PAEIVLLFDHLPQGRIGQLQATGENILRVRAAFLDHQYVLLPVSDSPGMFEGLISAPMDAETGHFRLSILVTYTDNTQEYFARDVRVTQGAFGQYDLALPGNLLELADPEVSLDEYAILDVYINKLTEGHQWRGLAVPFNTPVSAVFGTYRHINGSVWQRHTGIDYPRPLDTAVTASAGGRVVYSDVLPIRGNYVLIDHGSGLFSGYAHLHERRVFSGDVVKQGDIIGTVGNTGRSLGSHLHWEVAIGGVPVDPLEIVRLLPAE
ncbi:MAG TPA: M23 family metallopeptidase, partial [Aggregatilineales bacterium]|nr:M23 family metallopeptidase [Aggregatilineales bacterium]